MALRLTVAQGCYYAGIEDSWRKMTLVDGHMCCVEVEVIREYDEDLVTPVWRNPIPHILHSVV
jgi:hypothetical protein